jgi:hypothetical protein
MKKMPMTLPGYVWDVDRTADVVAVRVVHRGVTVGYYCYGVTQMIALRLRITFLHALWDEFVAGPIFQWVNAIEDWRVQRADRRAQDNVRLAILLDGRWDWRGRPIKDHH